ncbi:fido domain-containing protein [Xylariaceae sp. FL0255]|nr:fido domain-containing protein [Xylariaceae sp. FL0255]
MSAFIRDFNKDINAAIREGSIDPYVFAAKYCYKFVNIHPFPDGNGRTCRLILNALLLKYAGVMISLGEEDSSRDEYLTEAARASESQSSASDDDDDMPLPKHWKGLAVLTLQHAEGSLKNLLASLKG